MINNASKLYGKLLNKYETQNNKFPQRSEENDNCSK